MSTFVLIPGAGGTASYWYRIVPLLEASGHEAIAVDLPGDDESAGLPEYTDLVLAAVGERQNVVLVAQSMGGFTAPMVCARGSVGLLILVNAMIPRPGETPGEWWGNTGSEEARVAAARDGGYPAEVDLQTYFLHDLPAEVLASGQPSGRPEADSQFSDRQVPFDASELVFRVADMSVTLTALPGGSADEWFGPGGLSCFAPQRQVSEYLAGWLCLS